MTARVTTIGLAGLIATPALALECSFADDSIFRGMVISEGEGVITTRRGEERSLDCIGNNQADSIISCVYHFPDGDAAYIYTLLPDRTMMIFTAYMEGETAPALLHNADCKD